MTLPVIFMTALDDEAIQHSKLFGPGALTTCANLFSRVS
jgi:hypothetical protein